MVNKSPTIKRNAVMLTTTTAVKPEEKLTV
jgi:hypothetical protein